MVPEGSVTGLVQGLLGKAKLLMDSLISVGAVGGFSCLVGGFRKSDENDYLPSCGG
ncbi:24567_t:CDS:2 [Dentiscutata erythropus]|uniref:24567_t:CDS:1 n=1 Tax=Dentiscutata erythropus TaxID=1348616 RepID=A0A9N8WSM5_9GLOM|nr:24567_t:CDS:2 [Dentiscutata erythropus]